MSGSFPIANYPNGFTHGVMIRGLPVLNTYGNKTPLWVDSNGSASGDGTYNRPYTTLDAAINKASANDIIMIKPSHAETLTTANTVTMDVAGVAVIGLGQGSRRPTFTFTPVAVGDNSWAISAAGCSVENIIGKPGLDAITNPFNVSGASAYLDIEWQDTSSLIEAETVVLTTATADQITIKLVYRGFPAGNACIAPIKLNGATDARVEVDFYGLASIAVVNFVGTLSTNVLVTGYAYNSTDTTGVKLVVDTIGSSLWYADIYAGAAGQRFKGGSAATIAGDPTISSVTDALYGNNGITTWQAEAAAANGVDISAVLLYIQNAVRRGSGTTLAANKSIADALGTDGNAITDSAVSILGVIGSDTGTTAFASTNVVSNADGNVLERLEYLQVQDGTLTNSGGTATIGGILGDVANKSIATRMNQLSRSSVVPLLAAGLTGTTTQFTVSGGPILVKHLGFLTTTAIDAGANTLKFSFTPTGGGATDLCGATDTASAGTSQLFVVDGTKATGLVKTTDAGISIGVTVETKMPLILSTGVIQTIFSAGAPANGAGTIFMEWEPLSASSLVA